MKRLLFFFIFLALSGKISADVNSLNVKGVRFGTPYQSVLGRLGKPLHSKKSNSLACGGGKILTLRYSGLVIELVEGRKDFQVVRIEAASPKWSIDKGIKIGAVLKDVKGKLGKPDKRTIKSGSVDLFYFTGDGRANFYFKNNKLVKAAWEENLC